MARQKNIKRTSPSVEPDFSASDLPLLLDIRKAAAVLGVKVWTLRELVWAKRIPACKLGCGRTSKLYFTTESLKEFVKNQFESAA